ncbi:MAG: YcgN family cysteine cluster protein [Sphingomonadales bacterium]|nr:YcgN family cysteine cluster protein [Sphingomonadales bacterium]MBD3774132.1 YcgN family cysteine cluster protein [Paracoccaceae bacterium]
MGEVRERFWELPLERLTRAEWEALCDGCGQCCLHKLEDEDTGEIAHTNVSCRLLDTRTAQCRDYRNRKAFVPDCLRLTPRLVAQVAWLPASCAYRLRADGLPLYAWHHLISGSRETVHSAGISVAGKVIGEDEAGPLEHHIVEGAGAWATSGSVR